MMGGGRELSEGDIKSTEKKVITGVLGLPRHRCMYRTIPT